MLIATSNICSWVDIYPFYSDDDRSLLARSWRRKCELLKRLSPKFNKLERELEKLEGTQRRMLKDERWDIYFKTVDRCGEIIDEQHKLRVQLRDGFKGLDHKLDLDLQFEIDLSVKMATYEKELRSHWVSYDTISKVGDSIRSRR